MSNIPQARQNLTRLAKDLQIGRITKPQAAAAIRSAMRLLTRESPVRRAAVKRRNITAKLKAEIIAYANSFPDAQMADIAEWFNVNQGRVSEILNGKR